MFRINVNFPKEREMSIRKFITSVLPVVLLASISNATVITVGPSGDYQTIQDAINASSNGDEIIVAPGLYTPGVWNTHVAYIYNADVWLHSSDGPETTIIDGLSTKRCIQVSGDSNTHIEGFTIQNGAPFNGNGGGIYNNNASPTISNCVFINNESGSDGYLGSYSYGGGAIYNYWSNPLIVDCVFRENQASGNGGAISNVVSSSSSIVNCQFETNVAEKGGAIYIANLSSCSLSGCTFQQNLATFYGGAVYLLENCEVSISASNFEANYSDLGGGGIYNQGGILTVASCSFNQNISQPGNGGGIDLLGGGTATISNSEFTSNSAKSGGGIFISATSWLEMSFSMFCDNTGGNVVGNWADFGGNELNTSCDGTDGACCTNDICVLTDSETCNFVGGKFQGLKTICSEELCPTSCLADITGDGQVDVNDIMMIIAMWGACP